MNEDRLLVSKQKRRWIRALQKGIDCIQAKRREYSFEANVYTAFGGSQNSYDFRAYKAYKTLGEDAEALAEIKRLLATIPLENEE